jgi:hypothetical protein
VCLKKKQCVSRKQESVSRKPTSVSRKPTSVSRKQKSVSRKDLVGGDAAAEHFREEAPELFGRETVQPLVAPRPLPRQVVSL